MHRTWRGSMVSPGTRKPAFSRRGQIPSAIVAVMSQVVAQEGSNSSPDVSDFPAIPGRKRHHRHIELLGTCTVGQVPHAVEHFNPAMGQLTAQPLSRSRIDRSVLAAPQKQTGMLAMRGKALSHSHRSLFHGLRGHRPSTERREFAAERSSLRELPAECDCDRHGAVAIQIMRDFQDPTQQKDRPGHRADW